MSFFIKIVEAGGFEFVDGPFTLNIICAPASTSVITQSDFPHTQNVEMQVTANPVFFFEQYENDAGCPNQYFIRSDEDSTTIPIEFIEVATYDLTNFTMVARVTDSLRLRKDSYTFYLRVTAGASSIFTGPFVLNVYCGLNSAVITESSYDADQVV